MKLKKIAESYTRRIWNDRDLNAIDDFVHPNVKVHSLLGRFTGAQSLRNIVQAWMRGLPDLTLTKTVFTALGDLVAIDWCAKGTHQGEFKGIQPTGKPISCVGVTLYRVQKGKIIEYWAYIDMQHVLQQMQS